MNFVLDDIVRTMATPMPRRQALKLVGKTLAGAVAAAMIGARRVKAADCKGKGETSCADSCCSATQQCCHVTGQGLQKYCAPAGNICCGGSSCTPSSQQCCGSSCAPKSNICCGSSSCAPGQCCDKKGKCQASLTACK